MKRIQTDRHGAWQLLAACALGGLVQVACATGLDDFQAPLTDAQLNDMRGRFAQGGQVVYFGVTMQTQWQLADGGAVDAGLGVTLQGSHPAVVLNLDGSKSQAGPVAAAANIHLQPGGLAHIQGVAQSIQVGGDGNTVSNDVNIDIAWLPPHSSTAAAPPASGMPLPANGTLTVTQGGIETRASVTADGISLDLQAPGHGNVRQQLVGGSGIQQAVQLASDFNQVHNTFNIMAQLQPAGGPGAASMGNLLNVLKGLP